MDNQELLQAIQKMIKTEIAQFRDEMNEKISKTQDDIKELRQRMQDDLGGVKDDLSGVKELAQKTQDDLSDVKVLLDLDIKKNINLLGEGQQVIIDRLPNPDELEAIEARLSAVEVVMRKHSKEIQELKKAQ